MVKERGVQQPVSLDPHLPILAWGAVVLLGVWLVLLKWCFGTWSLPKALKQHRERTKAQAAYDIAFSRREELLFHLGWAKNSGDASEVRRLEKSLIGHDKDVEDWELVLREMDGEPRRKRE
ncbi:unnamed protein product [Chrysoparadoxa australica]